MAIFKIEKAKRGLYRAERWRVLAPPVAIWRMHKYAGAKARNQVFESGEANDWLVTAGAARIADVASVTLGKMLTQESQKQVLYESVVSRDESWFGQENVQEILTAHPETIHGSPIDWYGEHRQDMFNARLSLGDSETRESVLAEARIQLSEWSGDTQIHSENAGAASAAGVLAVRVARALPRESMEEARVFMEQGVGLVHQSHLVSPNPERLKVVLGWQDVFLRSTGLPEDARKANSWLSELADLGVSRRSLQMQRYQEQVVSAAWRGVFRLMPMDRLIS